MTEACQNRKHISCAGYVGPDLCECDCHDDEAQLDEVLEP